MLLTMSLTTGSAISTLQVNRDGFVASPYLNNWAHPGSALADAVEDASILFSGDSPIFSQPKGNVQPPPPPARLAG